MLKNILKSCIILPLFMLITSCAAPVYNPVQFQMETLQKSDILSPDLSIYDTEITAPPEDTSENTAEFPATEIPDRIAALDAQFDASHPEPDGSNASLTAYAAAYLEFWQGEVDAAIADLPELYDDYAAFCAALEDEIYEYTESFRTGEGEDAVYGREVVFAVPMRHAVRLREWLASALSEDE